jgi:hypothetical protein
MQAIFTIFFFLANSFTSPAVEKVTYYSSDSLKITADLYLNSYELPFIILFHNSESSRGEYTTIAPRLLKLGYNCLAVDLRVGNTCNYIQNETAERARLDNISRSFIDCKKDILASVKYVEKFNDKNIVLFGSSFSASLCLLVSKDQNRVNSVIAFSPGEFFRPEVAIKDQIKGLAKPIFVSATQLESEYVTDLLSGVSSEFKTMYVPIKGKGLNATKMLDESCESANDCWLDLLLFFKKIKNY